MPGALLIAVILGLVEGVTEFLPVSSTGHLRLVGSWLHVGGDREQAFEIFIQLGAIVAVVWDFRRPLISMLRRAASQERPRRTLLGIALAFVPAAIAGLSLHHVIERHLLFEGPIASALIVGGILILAVESRQLTVRTMDLESVTWKQALAVGLAQTAALFPGFSRSAATILGGLLVGMSRPVAAEFSFYLAIPTLTAAALYSLVKEMPHLGWADAPYFAVGFLVSFLSAAVVVRALMAFLRTRTFRAFAWYRIALGTAILAFVVWR